MCSAQVPEVHCQGCQASCSCSMVALNTQHKHLILFFPSIFKVVPQTVVRFLHGDAALDLNCCSVSLHSSVLHEEYLDRGDMALCYRPRNVNLSFSLCPY